MCLYCDRYMTYGCDTVSPLCCLYSHSVKHIRHNRILHCWGICQYICSVVFWGFQTWCVFYNLYQQI